MRKCASQLRHERLWAFHENRITRFERLRLSAIILKLYHTYFDKEENVLMYKRFFRQIGKYKKHDMNLNYNARMSWPHGVLSRT